MNQNYVLVSPEFIFTQSEDFTYNPLRAPFTSLDGSHSIPICQVDFENKHSLMILFYLIGETNHMKYNNVIKTSVKEICDGIGVKYSSRSIRSAVLGALAELEGYGLINSYKKEKVSFTPKYKRDFNSLKEIDPSEENIGPLKRGERLIEVDKTLIYDSNICKYFIALPSYIISHTELNYTDKLIYLLILKLSQYSRDIDNPKVTAPISTKGLEELSGLSNRTVKRATKKLEDECLIMKNSKYISAGDEYRKVVYYYPNVIVSPKDNRVKNRTSLLNSYLRELKES